jgi:DNA-binding NtrC family response regulator
LYAILIDDDPSVLDSVKTAVELAGLDIGLYSTWDEGMEAVFVHGPELVIADYHLPGSSMGLELLHKVARARPTVRLILFSAFLVDGDADQIEATGIVDRVVSKKDPVDSARAIVAEVRDARARSSSRTDWAAFAAAEIDRRNVDEEAFESLDRFLRRNRLGES